MADIRNIPLVLPDTLEQAEIVSYLTEETARIDATIQTIEQEIKLLAEYRAALISEVVMGKVRVTV
jgi:type I restriction enzyme, S subunit